MRYPEAPAVLLVGATGLVGSECLRLLFADRGIGRVVVLARRAIADGGGLRPAEVHVVDFDTLEHQAPLFRVDAIVCALGTTAREAGSKAEFGRVDVDYPLTLARLWRAQGARHFLLVSALGAEARSSLFYARVKGEVERAISELGYPRVTILRPSLLLGRRRRPRMAEEVAKRVAFLLPRRYRPIEPRTVAQALVRAVRDQQGAGRRVMESIDIPAYAAMPYRWGPPP